MSPISVRVSGLVVLSKRVEGEKNRLDLVQGMYPALSDRGLQLPSPGIIDWLVGTDPFIIYALSLARLNTAN